MKHRWSSAFERAYQDIVDPLDLRALRLCEAWIIWSDAFACRPDNILIQKFVSAQSVSQPEIARMMAVKLAASCPIPLPMQLPRFLIMLLDEDEGTGIPTRPVIDEKSRLAVDDPFDLSGGPRRY